jgi:hypothetical protein
MAPLAEDLSCAGELLVQLPGLRVHFVPTERFA